MLDLLVVSATTSSKAVICLSGKELMQRHIEDQEHGREDGKKRRWMIVYATMPVIAAAIHWSSVAIGTDVIRRNMTFKALVKKYG